MSQQKKKRKNGSKEVLLNIALTNIVEPSHALRSSINPDGIAELAESLKLEGLIEPVIVAPQGSNYEVVAGHRRYLAAIEAGLKEIPCIVRTLSPEAIFRQKMHENLYRQDLDPLEEAKAFLRIRDELGLSENEIAHKLGKSENYVHQRLNLLNATPELKEALGSGKITFTVARELAGIDDENVQKAYVHAAAENGCSAITAKLWKREYEKTKLITPQSDAVVPPAVQAKAEDKYQFLCQLCGKGVPYLELRNVQMCDDCYQALMIARRETESNP